MSSQKSVFSGPKYKIILVGDSNVGKTSIFLRYIYNQTIQNEEMTTIDFRYKMIRLHDKQIKLCIWDTAGQEKFRSIVATYFKSCQGVILVFDLSNRESWQNIKDIWYQLAFKRAPSANYLLLGNKKDLQRSVTNQQIHKWCTKKGIYFIQTCALTGQSVQQSFFTLSALIDSTQEYLITSSFVYTANSFNEETTKAGTRQNFSQRSSIKAVYKQQRSTSFLLKKKEIKISKKKEKCC